MHQTLVFVSSSSSFPSYFSPSHFPLPLIPTSPILTFLRPNKLAASEVSAQLFFFNLLFERITTNHSRNKQWLAHTEQQQRLYKRDQLPDHSYFSLSATCCCFYKKQRLLLMSVRKEIRGIKSLAKCSLPNSELLLHANFPSCESLEIKH